ASSLIVPTAGSLWKEPAPPRGADPCSLVECFDDPPSGRREHPLDAAPIDEGAELAPPEHVRHLRPDPAAGGQGLEAPAHLLAVVELEGDLHATTAGGRLVGGQVTEHDAGLPQAEGGVHDALGPFRRDLLAGHLAEVLHDLDLRAERLLVEGDGLGGVASEEEIGSG